MHPPNKENMFPPNMEKTCSLVHGVPPWGPTFLPTFSTICGGCPPPWGAPQHLLSSHKGLPPQGEAPQNSPHVTWDLVPSRWDKMFSATVTSEKFQKVPEHFRHPLKLSGHAPEHFQYGGLI